MTLRLFKNRNAVSIYYCIITSAYFEPLYFYFVMRSYVRGTIKTVVLNCMSSMGVCIKPSACVQGTFFSLFFYAYSNCEKNLRWEWYATHFPCFLPSSFSLFLPPSLPPFLLFFLSLVRVSITVNKYNQ